MSARSAWTGSNRGDSCAVRRCSAVLRVERDCSAIYVFGRMAVVLQRFVTLCLALALVVGVTGQLMPPSMAAAQPTMSSHMEGGCDGPQPPCNGQLPICLDHGGCITVSALPAAPAAISVPVEWTSLVYELARQALSGISHKPELSPPILAA